MERPIELRVRSRKVGGGLAEVYSVWGPLEFVTGTVPRLTILVHGFNNTEYRAEDVWEKTHRLLRHEVNNRELTNIAFFYWPGEVNGSRSLSAPLYFLQVPNAVAAGVRLAKYLDNTAARRSGLVVQFVGHSLGCRVVLSAIRELAGSNYVEIANVLLMAAAVSEGLCEAPRAYAHHIASEKEVVVHSTDDKVLRRAFPVGQWLARRRGDASPGRKRGAVGYTGGPTRRWDGERDSTGLDHGNYWSDPGCIKRIARLFALPQARKPNERSAPERFLEERRPPNKASVSHSFLAAAQGAPVGPI